MKKINIKSLIIGVFIGVLISSGVVYAVTLIDSKDVTYTPSDSSFDADNVKSALDELYERNLNVENSVMNWLKTANINKNYTSILQVLDDSETLQELISNNKGCDYLKTSHDWTKLITENENAMTYIGNNDYCANALSNDEFWDDYIFASNYWEKVLKPLVPAMTSNTSPSGQCFANASAHEAYAPFRAFDGNSSTMWQESTAAFSANASVGYKFTTPKVVKVIYTESDFPIYLEASNNGTNWTKITNLGGGKQIINNSKSYLYYRVHWDISGQVGQAAWASRIQFYGR